MIATKNPWKTHNHSLFFTKYPWKSMVFYALISLLLVLCYLSPFSFHTFTTFEHFSNDVPSISITSSTSNSLSTPSPSSSPSSNLSSLPTRENGNGIQVIQSLASPPKEITHISNGNGDLRGTKANEISPTCDYANGEWIKDNRGPLYNGTSCGTIKDGQNCMSHGRPDTDYLYWRWKPKQCSLSRFDPESFLRIMDGKHIAFIGDSLARNQLESLLCMLASISAPNLVYSNGEENKFRRWHFPSHNVTVSVYWSPFLVRGVEKSKDRDYNRMYLDSVDERWGSDLDSIDMVVLSVGHWYLLKDLYIDGGVELGCHGFEGTNCTDIGFYDPFGKAFNTSLKTIIQRKGVKSNGIDVIVTTFSPHHFEGEWDKLGACPKKMPYKEGDKDMEGMADNLRRIAVEEVEKARAIGLPNVRVEALDVTKLSWLRPDGHPGPYMYYNPFGDGIKERVHNDCVHWCLPGPIDTWNEIMSDIIMRWHTS